MAEHATATDWATVAVAILALGAAIWAGISAQQSSKAAQDQLTHMIDNAERAAASTAAMWITRNAERRPVVSYISDWPIFRVLVRFDIEDVHEVVEVPMIGPAKDPAEDQHLTKALIEVLRQAAEQQAIQDPRITEQSAKDLAALRQVMLAFPEADGLTAVAFAFVDMQGHHWHRSVTGELESVPDITQVVGMSPARVIGTGRE